MNTETVEVGDVVKTKSGKTLWIVESIWNGYAGEPYARVTKLEPNGEAARYVNTSQPLARLILVEKRAPQ